MAAPQGNQNAVKGKRWADAISRALEERSRAKQVEALDELAEKLLAACDAGELAALKELGDRLDGKAHQSVSGPDGKDLIPPVMRWEHVKPSDTGA